MLALLIVLAQAAAPLSPTAIAVKGIQLRVDTVDGYAHPNVNNRPIFYGYYVYESKRSTVDGKPAYLLIMNYRSTSDSFQSDTLAVDAATLAPLWHHFYARIDTALVTYHGRHATGWSKREGQRRVTIDHQLSEHAIDGTLLHWLLPAAQLGSGVVVPITSFSIWTNRETSGSLSVIAAETLEIGGKPTDTWVVRSASGVRRWIDKATPRIVRIHQPRDKGGGFWDTARR